MDISLSGVSGIETKPQASFSDFTNNMSGALEKMDREYNKMGEIYTTKIENLLPLPSENKFMQDMLREAKGPYAEVTREAVNQADKMTIFTRENLRKQINSAVFGGAIKNVVKGGGLITGGIKQLISAG